MRKKFGCWFLVPTIGNTIFLSIFFTLVFKTGSGLLGDGDTGYHIRAGEFILENRSIPGQDIFSFLTPPLKWTLHEWLSEVIMAAIHGLFGLTGIVIFFALLIALVHLLLYKTLRDTGSDVILTTLVAALAATSSSTHWLARPHIFSLALLLVWFLLLEAYQYRNKQTLYYLPPLMLLWVNLHGGYIMGLIFLAIYFGGNVISYWASPPSVAAQSLTKTKKLGLTGVACVAAALLNPEGYRILLFPFEVTSNRFVMDNVQEFLSPNFHDRLPFKYMLILFVGVLAASRRAVTSIELACILLLTYMSLYSARYTALFAVIMAYPLLRLSAGLLAQLPVKYQEFFRARSLNLATVESRVRGYFWPVIGVALVIVLAMVGVVRFEFDRQKFPVAAVEFLKKEPLWGNMFNDDEIGDYMIYAAWPQYRVFMDGRSDMYGAKIGSEYLTVTRVFSGWQDVLKKYEVEWIIVNTGSTLATVLKDQSDWHLTYYDSVASVFVKKGLRNQLLIEKYPQAVEGQHTNKSYSPPQVEVARPQPSR